LYPVAGRAGRDSEIGERQLPVGMDGERQLLPAQRQRALIVAKQYPEATAYHEAGHAVVACRLVLKVARIHIDEHGEGGGTEIECADGLTIVEQVALRVAGMEAENMSKQKSMLLLSQDDRKRLVILLSGHSDECREEICEKGFALARKLLDDHKDKVKRIAEDLIKHGQLSGGDFALIMRGHY